MIEKYITYTLRESGYQWLQCLKWYLASLQSMLQIEIEGLIKNSQLIYLDLHSKESTEFPCSGI